MRQGRRYSARLKVTIITFIILVVQVFIFYLVFSKIDVLGMLEGSTYRYNSRRLEQSAEKLENQMLNSYSSKKSMSALLEELEYFYLINKDKEKQFKVNHKISKLLLQTLSNTKASGIFVLLNKDMSKNNKSEDVFFIRDSNLDFDVRDNSDIRVEMGSKKLAEMMNLKLAHSWKAKTKTMNYKAVNIIRLQDKLKTSLENNAEANPENLAFWEGNVDLMEDKQGNLVYVYPLIDKYSKTLYGMIGIEVDSRLVAETLDVDSLSSEFSKGFALASNFAYSEPVGSKQSTYVIDYFGDFIDGVKKQTKVYYSILENKYYEKSGDRKKMYHLQNKARSSAKIFILPRKLNLYPVSSIHKNDEFNLLLILNEENLFYHQSSYTNGIIISVIVSIIFALLLSILLSNYLTKPIRVLVKEIEEIDVRKKIQFEETNTTEMNLLKNRIEQLSYDVGSFYFKMQNLLEVIGRTIVILEEDIHSDTIYRTGRISALLGTVNLKEELVEEMTKYKFKNRLKAALKGMKREDVYVNEHNNSRVIGITKPNEKKYIKYEKKMLEDKVFHIYMDYTEEYNNIVKLEKEKNYDFLTLLPNRSYFKELVSACIKKYPKKKYAMVMWDLDNLKYINDIFGHDWGDTYLKQTAKVLKTLEGDIVFVSRFSGDEFFAFINYEGDKEEVRRKVQNLQNKLLSSRLEVGDYEEIKIRASVGMCWYPDDAETYDDLYKYSDFAMYQAKHSNKGTIVEFDKRLYERDNIVILGKEEFNRLIEQKLVEFAFQPIVCSKTAEIFGYEALMRSKSESINSVEKVMKLARVQFKLPQIEELTFEGVFEALEENEEFIKDKRIFINSIASVVLPDDKNEIIQEKLAKYGDMIVVEITESEEINNDALKIKKQYRHQFGSQIAIDDFGSGYSTETTLLKINPDFLKIDMDIIRNIHSDKNKYQLVGNIIEYSKVRGIKTIAEGVETEEELYAVMELGADYIQGFYLARPSLDIGDLLEEKREKVLDIRKQIDIGMLKFL